MKFKLLAFAGSLLLTVIASAHHSLAATYLDKEVKLEGKILDLLLRNPHSFLQIEAPDENGMMQRWSLEWRSSGQLGQQGIKRDTLKVGDEVTITMNPSRTAGDHRGKAIIVQQVIHDPAKEYRGQNLGNHDKEVEDPHVDAGLLRRQRARQNGIGHGQDAGPGDPDADHGEKQNVFVADDRSGEKTNAAAHEA